MAVADSIEGIVARSFEQNVLRLETFGSEMRGSVLKLEKEWFKMLGINTIWISMAVNIVDGPWGGWPDPQTAFSAYHGYWPISFAMVDDRSTSEVDLTKAIVN